VDLRKTTQEEFSGIQKTSTISQAPAIKSELPLKEGMQKKIELLEQKAVNVTLGDIQKYDNLLFKQMQTLNIKSADDLNNAAMQNLIKEAPKAPPKSTRKPFKSELDDIQSGAYEKYFKDIK
ncbi:MAG: hypothetical protein ABI041_13955, partial [Bdellovibrionia bacterium]